MNKTEKFILQKLGKDSLEELEQQDYIGLIRQLNKYGLRFEEQPEEVEEKLKDFYPVLTDYNREAKTINLAGEEKEVKEIKDIINDEKGKMNYIIEGDNLHGLKAIEKTYQNSIDLVIIDPPYNTGNEFKYNDKMVGNDDSYRHSKWLSFMEKRLRLARDLMTKEGVIFINIDDNEQANLTLLMNEVFGENCVETLIWNTNDPTEGSMPKTASLTVRKEHEYVICGYKKKNKSFNKYEDLVYENSTSFSNPDNDERGEWMSGNISRNGIKTTTGSKYFTIKNPNGDEFNRNWTISKEEYLELLEDDRMWFGLNGDGVPRIKIFKNEPKEVIQSSILSDLKTSITGKRILENILDKKRFDYPKPPDLIKRLITISTGKNSTILDFFAGSGTTGHAVLDLNKEDGGNRNFILMTNNENTSLNKKYLIWDYLVENNIIKDYSKTKFTSTGKRYQYYKNHINKNFPLNIDKYYNIEIKKEHQENKKLQKFIETDKFKTFLENLKLYIADNGICQNVTYPRMRKVIEGYTDSKGNKVEGLGGNLSYLKTDFVPKYKELDKRELALSNKIYNLIKMSEEAHIEINVEEDFYKLYKSEVKENKIVAFYNRVLDYNELKTIQNKMEEFKDYKKIVYIRNGIDFEDKLISELQEKGYIFKEIPEELMYL